MVSSHLAKILNFYWLTVSAKWDPCTGEELRKLISCDLRSVFYIDIYKKNFHCKYIELFRYLPPPLHKEDILQCLDKEVDIWVWTPAHCI